MTNDGHFKQNLGYFCLANVCISLMENLFLSPHPSCFSAFIPFSLSPSLFLKIHIIHQSAAKSSCAAFKKSEELEFETQHLLLMNDLGQVI